MRVLESASPVESVTHLNMALQKYAPSGNAPSVNMKHLSFSSKVPKKAELDEANLNHNMDVDIDLREIYFLIMHFLSAGPCHKTHLQFWNELLEHQLLPRRYHAWYSRTGACSGDKDDDGLSFPLNYNMLVERYSHIEKDHLVKLLKQLLLNTASPSLGMNLGNAPNAADVPTLLGSGSFSLLSYDRDKMKEVKWPPPHMRWPHMKANQVHGLNLREIGGGFPRHHRAPSIRAACYAIAKPSTMVQKMQNIKRLRGHRNAVYCAIFDRAGRYVITGSDDRLVKIWSMETAYCLASCRGHDGDITDLAVSSNNALVASSSNDCVIRVWRLPDGLPISVLRGHTGAVTAIAFSPRPNAVYQLLSNIEGANSVLSGPLPLLRHSLRHAWLLQCHSWNKLQKIRVICGLHSCSFICPVAKQALATFSVAGQGCDICCPWKSVCNLPSSIPFSSTGVVLANLATDGSSDDGTCRIWDARYTQSSPRLYVPRPSDSVIGKSNGPSSSTVPQSHQIFCCAFNANGTVFVTGSSDNLARVWNACKLSMDDTGQPVHEIDVLSGHENDVNYVQFSGCAVASRFSTAETWKEENIPKFKNSWLNHDNIVTCSRDGSAIIWIPKSRRSHGKSGRWTRAYHLRVPPPPMPPQPQRGGPRQRILPTPRGVNMIVWSLDNRFVLAAIMDCRICVWNASDGSLVHSLTGHTESTYVLDVHPFNPRIAMSAGYDGRTIVWDIWEGLPIRTYEISRFKLVDGKFSPDGTSIILSDDVGQLYILSTGQGESQKDAKYDQFFLGDYRPLIQDTHGNVLDQETQIVPYRRSLQDLLCDSAMIPYPEPYQSEFQQRRLGALGFEWRPSSLRLAVGPDFSLDPDYHMLPLADLDLLTEPLPEFIDAMEWEPEVEVFSDDTDSEYNVTEDFSSKGEKGCSSSNASGDSGCSTDNSEGEDTCMDNIRRSKRKKQKTETEVMTSSGRRVKRRNLDERDGNTFGSSRSRKGKSVQKTLRRKSSKSKSSRPQRAAARNALHLFSKITGTPTDGEEDSLVGDFSGSESTLQESNIDSDESDGTLQNEQLNYSKGKDVSYYESENSKSHELTETHVNLMNKRRLVLKLPNRDISKSTNEFDYQTELVGSSSKSSQEATDFNGNGPSSKDSGYYSGSTSYPTVETTDQAKLDQVTDHVDLLGKIRWGMVRARSSKPLRVGEAMPSDTNPYSGKCPNHLDEKENVGSGHEKEDKNFSALTPELEIQKDDHKLDSLTEINYEKENVSSGHEKEDKNASALTPELEIQKDDYKVDSLTEINENCAGTTSQPFNPTEDGREITASSNCRDKDESLISAYVIPQDIVPASISYSEVDQLPELNIGFPSVLTKLRSKRGSRDPESPSKHETKSSVLKNSACSTNDKNNFNNEQHVVVDDHNNTRVASNQGENGSQEVDPQIRQNSTSQDLPEPHSQRDKMYKAVYRRSRSHRAVTNLADSSGQGEFNSNGRNSNFNATANFSNGTNEAIHTNGSLELEPTTCDPNYERNNLKVLQGPGNCMVKSPQNVSTSGGQLTEEERGSNSKLTVGLRSNRNRRSSYNICETSPVNKRKSLQSATRGSWLLLSTHEEGCRYIPQQGDEVAYLRQGHQEYIDYCRKRESGPWVSLKGHIRAVEYCRVQSLEYSHLPGSGDSCCKMNLQFVDPNSSVVGKSFKLTLPEVTSFPDFLVERTRFDAAMQRNWTRRDKCRVWWKNEDSSSGNWWDGRILCMKAKSSEFPDSPWESYTVRYKSDLTETHLHSPWELFDADTEWEQPHIDDDMRNKLQSTLTKLQQSGNPVQDRYGVHELKKISNKSKFINRFPVPISIELIQSRLENNYYRSLEALKHDVSILLSNATTFLEKDAALSAKIKRLSEWFTRTLSSL
ncbi:PH-interacting protein [Glycine soja]